MAIADDWNVDFVNKTISHKDGTLAYDTTSGTPTPAAGHVVRGATNGALVKVLSNSGSALTVTETDGRFADNEVLNILESVNFDNVTNSGFAVGDTIYGNTSNRTGVVYKIEYNMTSTGGYGTAYGLFTGGSGNFTNDEELKHTNGAGTTRALANGTGSGDYTWAAQVNNLSTGTVIPPSASDCAIINFDGGTEAIPRFCVIQDTDDGSPNKTAVVQKVYGVTATGSLRIIDTTGTAWANDNSIYVQKLPYDNLQTGQKFKVGDKVVTKATEGGSVSATGKVIAVETLTSTTGKLTLQGKTGTLTNDHRIEVRTTSDTYVADINAATAAAFQDLVAAVNVNSSQPAEYVNQLATQGGIYNGGSLNIIRDSNALYTFLQDQFDELGALDDTVPISAQVALQQFTLINGWKIPDLSYRFLESGSIQDSSLDNIWTNYQTLGSVQGIGDTVYAATTPLPQFYIEQNASVLSPWWISGHMDVLVKVKTNTNMATTTNADGVLINSGTITLFNRNYTHTYDHFSTTTIAGVAPLPLATAADLNNTTGTHSFTFTGTGGQLLLVGEEIVSSTPSDPTKRGIITAITTGDSQATGTITYINTGATAFANTNVVTGQTSGVTKTLSADPTNVVAGYGSRVIVATVDYSVAGTVSGTFVGGELVTAGGGGTGTAIFMKYKAGTTTIYVGNASTSPAFAISSGQTLTGAVSGAVFTATGSNAAATTLTMDINDGAGDVPTYNAVIFCNRDNQGNGDTLAHMYEWVKYKTRSLETGGEPVPNLLGGPGSATGYQGRLYTTLSTSYPLVKASPFGTFAGGTFFGAQGVFVANMASADIRSYQLIDTSGTVRNPPNQQAITVTGLVSGDRVAVFRTDPAISTTTIMTDEFKVGAVGAGYNQAADTQIKVASNNRAVPMYNNVPSTGVLRVLDPTDTGLYLSFNYNAIDRTNGVFTLTTGDIQAVTGTGNDLVLNDNAFVVFIEQQASGTSVTTNVIYDSTDTGDGGPGFPILSRVRRKGILPFEVAGNFSSTGSSTAAIRSFDSIVD